MNLLTTDISTVVGFLIGSFCLGYAAGYVVYLFKKITEQI